VHRVSRSFSIRVKNDVGPVGDLKLKVSRFKLDAPKKLMEQPRSADPNNFEEIFGESTHPLRIEATC
jgi:hypothetical protein